MWCMIINIWLVVEPTEKYEFVSWDDEIPNPNIWKIESMFQTTKQFSNSW